MDTVEGYPFLDPRRSPELGYPFLPRAGEGECAIAFLGLGCNVDAGDGVMAEYRERSLGSVKIVQLRRRKWRNISNELLALYDRL